MVELTSLLVPLVLSAIFVFVASSIIHMFLGYHANDFAPLPNEEVLRTALRVPPGDYVTPHASSMQAMKAPEFTQKMKEGPVAFITVAPHGSTGMGRNLALWFLYCLVVSLFAAYIAGRALMPGASYLEVFRFTGATAFLGYGMGIWQDAIWYSRSATSRLKSTFDALVFAALTAGTFGWLWP